MPAELSDTTKYIKTSQACRKILCHVDCILFLLEKCHCRGEVCTQYREIEASTGGNTCVKLVFTLA